MKRTYLGIEIGGSKLQAALGDGHGTISHLRRVRAEPSAGREGICSQIAALVEGLFDQASIESSAIAGSVVGFGGPVNLEKNMTIISHQVAGWKNYPLGDWFEEELALDVRVCNDSDLAGLAEALIGAGRGFSPVVYMNIGSGIGGAFIVEGRLFAGQGIGSTEIGHLRLVADQPGNPWRTLESLASGWSLEEQASAIAKGQPNSLLASLRDETGQISVPSLVKAVKLGDADAEKIWQRAIEHIAIAMSNVITLLDPARFVVGGGVALVGDPLFEPLRKEVVKQGFVPFAGTFEIVPAELGEEVVLHGALLRARQLQEDH